jgi:hypothetical protein
MPSYTYEELQGSLVVAYGTHVVSGHVTKKTTVGSGDSAQSTVVVWLGEGVWQGIRGAYWNGAKLSDSTYHFHHGYLAESMAEAIFENGEWNQGVDPWNYGGIPYSGTAYVIVQLPAGVTSEDDLSELKFICDCLRVPDFDDEGNQIDDEGNIVSTINQPLVESAFTYSTNPARCIADLLLVRRGLPRTRINWTAWHEWKLFCDVEIDWIGGEQAGRPAYQNVINATLGVDGNAFKSGGTNTWDGGVTTVSFIPNGDDGWFSADPGVGFMAAGLSTNTSNVDRANLKIGLQFGGITDNVRLYLDGVDVADIGTWTASDTYKFSVDSNAYRILKNDIPIDLSAYTLPVPSGDLYGTVLLQSPTSEVLRSAFRPINSGRRTRKRFECGLAFPNQTDIQAAADAILLISCSNVQDGDGVLTFVPPTMASAPRTSTFPFNMSNIIEGSFKTYRQSRDARPTKVSAKFRNTDVETLREDPVDATRDELVDILGREQPFPEIFLGTMTKGQSECVMNYQIRMQSDLDLYCVLEADGTSWEVLPADVVDVSHDVMGWTNEEFLVIEATDHSSIDGQADTRRFLLQKFNPGTYSDEDQTPIEVSITPTIPTSLTAPPQAISLSLTKSTDYGSGNNYTTKIMGNVVFKDFLMPQRARVYIHEPDDVSIRLTQYTVTPANPNFEILATKLGEYTLYVLTENEIGIRATDNPEDGVQDSITVALPSLPAPTDLSLIRIANDLAITWQAGLPSFSDLRGERYIVRIKDLITNNIVRTHEITIPNFIPCKWTYYSGTGNQTFIHLDPDGTIECDAGKGGILSYRSQDFNIQNGFILEFETIDKYLGSITVIDSTTNFTTGVTIWNRAGIMGDFEYVNAESFDLEKRRVQPLSKFRIDGSNKQAEYMIDEKFWVHSSRQTLPSTIAVVALFLPDSTFNADMAMNNVRVKPLIPRQFLYTRSMQETDFGVLSVPASVGVEVTQVGNFYNIELESSKLTGIG